MAVMCCRADTLLGRDVPFRARGRLYNHSVSTDSHPIRHFTTTNLAVCQLNAQRQARCSAPSAHPFTDRKLISPSCFVDSNLSFGTLSVNEAQRLHLVINLLFEGRSSTCIQQPVDGKWFPRLVH